jgi:hypothetical protein
MQNQDEWLNTLEGLHWQYKEASQALNAHRKRRRRMVSRSGDNFNLTAWNLEYRRLLAAWRTAYEVWYSRWQAEGLRPFDRSARPPE